MVREPRALSRINWNYPMGSRLFIQTQEPQQIQYLLVLLLQNDNIQINIHRGFLSRPGGMQ